VTTKSHHSSHVIHRPNSRAAEMERLEKEVYDVVQRYRKLFGLTDTELHLVLDRVFKNNPN
jgi:hypothetical protein